MKNKLIVGLILPLTFTVSAFAASTTFTGVLTDDMCTKKHMMGGKSNADCVRDCIKHGAKYVVVANGKTYELSGNQEQFNDLAGKKVKVSGELKGKTLTVQTIEAAQ